MTYKPTVSPRHTIHHNLGNALLCIAVALPSWFISIFINERCEEILSLSPPQSFERGWSTSHTCALSLYHPILFVHLLFFLNVTVLFWLISLVQNSTWLIDPYWTLSPLLISYFYQYHPLSLSNPTRSYIGMSLMWVWCLRLTYNYFRREEWCFGAREDWRFKEMREREKGNWWWKSFFIAFLSQQFMLVSLSLPWYAIYSSSSPFSPLDIVATLTCISGLYIADRSDRQLRLFILMNEKRERENKKKIHVLSSGLFHFSRHPNHFGELLWWWGTALFSLSCGYPLGCLGAVINSVVVVVTVRLVEDRMVAKREREREYREYMRKTSCLIPWPPSK